MSILNDEIKKLREAARAGNIEDQLKLAKLLLKQSVADSSGTYLEAIKLIEVAAKSGNLEAQIMLADEQSKSPETYESAIKWFESAAKNKNSYALKRLGELYYLNGKNNDEVLNGLDILRRSARSGNMDASYLVGSIYLSPKTDKIHKDEDEALHFLKFAASKNHIRAIKSLAFIYATGSESGKIKRDMELSKKYFETAIELGSVDSYYDLSILLFKEAFKVLNDGVKAENENNLKEKNKKINLSTNLKNTLKSQGVDF